MPEFHVFYCNTAKKILGVIAVFVIIMVFVAGYVFTREATKPF